MALLIIDTATELGWVTLMVDGEVVDARHILHRSQGTELVDQIRLVCKQLPRDAAVAAIGLGVGPGSYTGLRIAAAAAKSLAYAWGCPLVPLFSLQGYVLPQDGAFITAFDAKVSGLYFMVSERVGSTVTSQSDPSVASIPDVLSFAIAQNLPIVFPARGQLVDKLTCFETVSLVPVDPSPELFSIAAWTKLQEAKTTSAHELELCYLRGDKGLLNEYPR